MFRLNGGWTGCMLMKYHARAVKGGDLRSSACSAWVRIPLVLFFMITV